MAEQVDKWESLYSNTTLSTKTGHGPDLAHKLEFANSCSLDGSSEKISQKRRHLCREMYEMREQAMGIQGKMFPGRCCNLVQHGLHSIG